MGIDIGIIVVKQITDEKAWNHAMEDVRKSFENEDYFKELPGIETDQRVLTVDQLRMLKITEPLNFSTRGQGFCQGYHWQSFDLLVSSEDRKLPVRDALQLSRTRLEKKTRSSYEEDKLNCIITALVKYDSLDLDSQELVMNREIRRVEPPTLFEFAVGEHPRLPILGRHFKNCYSKISGGCGGAQEVINRLHAILKTHFPDNIKFWYDEMEDLDGRFFKNLNQEKEEMSQVYKRMEMLVGISTVEEVKRARKLLADE